jgi:NAD(P)-dependent dehydrogenase (short-subunit alcohol dehydrogenase family)
MSGTATNGSRPLEGRRVLVTGGSRGIGRAIALRFAQLGASGVVCHRRPSADSASLGAALARHRDGWGVVEADVADPESVAALVAGARERLGGIDVLVNNAGVVTHVELARMELEQWREVLDTNLTGMYLVTRACAEAMGTGAAVVNVTSAVAMVGLPGRTHYTASKAGVIGFTRSLAKELGPRGIRANAIAPGVIDTDQASGLTPEQRARYAQLAALGRLGTAEDVAEAAVFLAGDGARFVSGVTLNVDGGI